MNLCTQCLLSNDLTIADIGQIALESFTGLMQAANIKETAEVANVEYRHVGSLPEEITSHLEGGVNEMAYEADVSTMKGDNKVRKVTIKVYSLEGGMAIPLTPDMYAIVVFKKAGKPAIH